MDAQVIAGLNSLNSSIQNAAQLASASGDSKRAEQMHWEDIKWTDKWRNEDKDFARETNQQAYEWTKEFANMDYEHQKEFIEMVQRYNSPLEQVKMLREAGLNPALAFGDKSSIGVGGSGSHSVPSHSIPSSLGMPSQSGYFRAPNLGDPAQSFAAIASAYQAISQSKKSDVETTQLQKSADALLRKITAEADFAEVGATLEREFGRGDRSRSQQLADQKIAETVASIQNLAKQGEFIEAETAVRRVEKLIKDNELESSNIELQYLPDQLRATINNIKSSTEHNYASAVYQRKQAENVEYDNVRQNWINGLLQAKDVYEHDEFRNLMLSQFNESLQRGELTKQQVEQLKQTLPSLIQQAENAAKLGTPWSAEYFVDKALGALSVNASAGVHAGKTLLFKH